MTYETILYETRGNVALITLNRPAKLNAWTPGMAAEQAAAIEHANASPEIGAIVLTGAGRGFCAGADMEATFKSRLGGVDPGADTAAGQGGIPADLDWVALARRSKPLLAAVGGAAVGIGMTMILPFDVIVASEKAKFGMFFIKMGLVPERETVEPISRSACATRMATAKFRGRPRPPAAISAAVFPARAVRSKACECIGRLS